MGYQNAGGFELRHPPCHDAVPVLRIRHRHPFVTSRIRLIPRDQPSRSSNLEFGKRSLEIHRERDNRNLIEELVVVAGIFQGLGEQNKWQFWKELQMRCLTFLIGDDKGIGLSRKSDYLLSSPHPPLLEKSVLWRSNRCPIHEI